MPHVLFTVEGTPDEKLAALCALAIQQQGCLHLLTVLVADLYANANEVPHSVAAPLIDELLPKHIATAAEEFRQYVLQYQIAVIKEAE
jgi:hypothetical protein